MSQPGDSVIQHFRIETAAGVDVTGLTGADFTFKSYIGTALVAWTPTITEIGLGWYALTYTLPTATTAYSRKIDLVSSLNILTWPDIVGEIESADLDSISALVVRPIAVTDGNFAPSNELTFSYVADDTQPIIFAITDAAGQPVDLTAYGTFGFGIRSIDGVASDTQISTGITGSALGVVEVTITGSENFHSFITDGEASVSMRWDFQATKTSNSKIYTLARGDFIVLRQEFGA